MNVQKDLPELIKAGVISQEVADSISSYYSSKSANPQNKLLIVFGILGAVLVGLGIVLIIAHNWDELPKPVQLCIAFFPLVICQLLSVFVLLKKKDSVVWRESVAVLLLFAIATAISLVSQVYHIYGDLASFLLTWMLLSLPVVYILWSSIASLLYIIGITWYAVIVGYAVFSWRGGDNYYWLLLLLIIPFYYFLYKQKPASNFMVLHNWLVPISVAIALGTAGKSNEEFLFIGYTSLFGLFYIIGNTVFFDNQKSIANGYKVLGSLGTLVILLILSFRFTWSELQRDQLEYSSPEFYASLAVTFLAGAVLYLRRKHSRESRTKPFEFVFLFFIPVFFLGMSSTLPVVLINLLVLGAGIFTIIDGIKANHLGILNYGLLIITALIVCRFFDTDLSFVVRGLLFVMVGIGFFIANYQMIKKRKEHAEQ